MSDSNGRACKLSKPAPSVVSRVLPSMPTKPAITSMRHVLFIAGAFPPLNSSGTQRAFQFARRLPEFGWMPVVVTLDWEKEPFGNALDFELLDQVPPEIPVYRFPYFNPAVRAGEWWRARRSGHSPHGTVAARNGGSFESHVEGSQDNEAARGSLYRLTRRIYHFSIAPIGDEHFYWALRARGPCREIARRHDVQCIFATLSPWSSAILGLHLQARLRRPLVVDFRDYWTRWAVRGRRRIRDRWEQSLERRILRRADRIVCVHQAMADDLLSIEPAAAGKCTVITNGFDESNFCHFDRDGAPRESGGAVLTHTGIAWGDSAQPVLETVARERENLAASRLRIRFVGGLSPEAETFIRENHLADLIGATARVPHSAAIAELASADALLLLLVNNEGGRKWYPGKLFEYLAARKPIIAVAPEGITTRLVQSLGAGVVVDPSDRDHLRRVLGELAKDPASFRRRYYHLRADALGAYERGALTAKLAAVLESPAAGDRLLP